MRLNQLPPSLCSFHFTNGSPFKAAASPPPSSNARFSVLVPSEIGSAPTIASEVGAALDAMDPGSGVPRSGRRSALVLDVPCPSSSNPSVSDLAAAAGAMLSLPTSHAVSYESLAPPNSQNPTRSQLPGVGSLGNSTSSPPPPCDPSATASYLSPEDPEPGDFPGGEVSLRHGFSKAAVSHPPEVGAPASSRRGAPSPSGGLQVLGLPPNPWGAPSPRSGPAAASPQEGCLQPYPAGRAMIAHAMHPGVSIFPEGDEDEGDKEGESGNEGRELDDGTRSVSSGRAKVELTHMPLDQSESRGAHPIPGQRLGGGPQGSCSVGGYALEDTPDQLTALGNRLQRRTEGSAPLSPPPPLQGADRPDKTSRPDPATRASWCGAPTERDAASGEMVVGEANSKAPSPRRGGLVRAPSDGFQLLIIGRGVMSPPGGEEVPPVRDGRQSIIGGKVLRSMPRSSMHDLSNHSSGRGTQAEDGPARSTLASPRGGGDGGGMLLGEAEDAKASISQWDPFHSLSQVGAKLKLLQKDARFQFLPYC